MRLLICILALSSSLALASEDLDKRVAEVHGAIRDANDFAGLAQVLNANVETLRSADYLYITHKCLTDEQLIALIPMMTQMPSLRSIDFGSNCIGDVGVKALAKAKLNTLSSLALDRNFRITKEGAKALLKASFVDDNTGVDLRYNVAPFAGGVAYFRSKAELVDYLR
jgi:hypothetical protein